VGLSKKQAVLVSDEVRDLSPWDGIFSQSFILRRFSLVEESEGSVGQLEIETHSRFETLKFGSHGFEQGMTRPPRAAPASRRQNR
jgi:hypothetical protein